VETAHRYELTVKIIRVILNGYSTKLFSESLAHLFQQCLYRCVIPNSLHNIVMTLTRFREAGIFHLFSLFIHTPAADDSLLFIDIDLRTN